jgi:putative transcriptional regulator
MRGPGAPYSVCVAARFRAGPACAFVVVIAAAASAAWVVRGGAPVVARPHPRPPALAVRLEPAPGRLLVARPGLPDANFAHSVVLLVEADGQGAWGVIVNRPTDTGVATLFPDFPFLRSTSEVVHLGGPVRLRRVVALVGTAGAPADTVAVLQGVRLCSSIEALEKLAAAGAPFRVFAGYAGWGAGQLDGEIVRGDWTVTDADAGLLFGHDGEPFWELLVRRGSSLVAAAAPDAARALAP